jgi:nucleotide-binding universal stress UspA family protein
MRVLAALDNSAAARPVVEYAAELARVLAADVDALHIRGDGGERALAAAEHAGVVLRTDDGDPRAQLRREAEEDDVVAVVLGRSRQPAVGPVGSVALELLTRLPKPVAVVPAEAAHPGRVGRVLVPLEGTRSTSLAPRRPLELAHDAGLEIVLVHVFDADSLPPVTDQPQHETAAWANEFLARYSPVPPEHVRLESRLGDPGEQIVLVAREIDADMIALGWTQELASGRAPIVCAALEQAKLPVLLIPVVTIAEDDPENAPTSPVSAAAT